jgi:hypothetical protein
MHTFGKVDELLVGPVQLGRRLDVDADAGRVVVDQVQAYLP